MPMAPARPCRKCHRPTLNTTGYCDNCEPLRKKQKARQNAIYDLRRGSPSRRGYGRRWRKFRRAFLAGHPLCAACSKAGIITVATEVDHIVPHRGDQKLMWDRGNLQSLCKRCHSRKTATEDGGFGNRRKEKEG